MQSPNGIKQMKYRLLLASPENIDFENELKLLTEIFKQRFQFEKTNSSESCEGISSLLLQVVPSEISSDISQDEVRKEIRNTFSNRKVDFMFSTETFFNQQRGLVCFDMDSCILKNECIDEMAFEAGVSDQVSQITRRAMEQGLDFSESLRQRLALLKGLPVEKLLRVWDRLELNPGAFSLMSCLKNMGFKTALISGGFTFFAYHVAAILQMDYAFSNTLGMENGCLTGTVTSAIVDGQMKANILTKLAQKKIFPLIR